MIVCDGCGKNTHGFYITDEKHHKAWIQAKNITLKQREGSENVS